MTLDPVLHQYAWNLAYAEALTDDVPTELWARSGGPGLENHPAWTLGHLVTGSALVADGLGVQIELADGWTDLFLRRGPSDERRPDPDEQRYPPKDAVLLELTRLHDLVSAALRAADIESLGGEEQWRFDGYLPTRLDSLLFMLVAHETVHLGQLGCWRRRFELPSAMAAMQPGP